MASWKTLGGLRYVEGFSFGYLGLSFLEKKPMVVDGDDSR